eukprot:TRINITY_DN2038_c0_g2_i1.p1 TRINITY_DN2038_c0_g2~~TRINITY_DN2038_c0_g2_i1.p1  ORF type:complete len:804 (-),score=252.31 TRINITY_DN2038_c0_g2_i1:749-3160(-)
MTHGVEVHRLIDEKQKLFFSFWDFAGHEEYHVAHSFFFSKGCVYLLLFDCSLDLRNIINKNKLLYWFHFLQTQIGDATVILIATKLDLLFKNLQSENKEETMKQRLNTINDMISKEIEKNKIILKFHLFFDKAIQKDIYFIAVNNFSFEAEGARELQRLLASEYDSNKYGISATLKHKIVWEEIKLLSNMEMTDLKDIEGSFKWLPNLFYVKKENSPSKIVKKEPILYIQKLKAHLLNKKDLQGDPIENLEEILLDLHKLGIILYFDHPKLKDLIITDPQWLNNVFRVFLDYGRKEIALMLENMYEKINSHIKIFNNNSNVKTSDLIVYREQLKIYLKILKGKDLEEMSFHEIFRKYKGRRTRVELMSFEELYNKLEYFEKMNQKTKFYLSFPTNYSPVYMIEDEPFECLLNVLNPPNSNLQVRDYIFNLLISFEIVFPKGRMRYDENGTVKQTYIVPLLFPPSKPKRAIQSDIFEVNNLKKEEKEEKREGISKKNFEWILSYHLPFKPSSIWKRLFLRIRSVLMGKNDDVKMISEFFWIDGCFFELEDILFDVEIVKVKNLSLKEENTNMILKISSQQNPLSYYLTIKSEIEDYLYTWLNKNFVGSIKYSLIRKNVRYEEPKMLLLENKQSIHEKENGKDNVFEENNIKETVLCAYCGLEIIVGESTERCENCLTKQFLIENQFYFVESVTAGGFGRLIKAKHKKTSTFVAIKERRKKEQKSEEIFKREVFFLRKLERETDILFPRLIHTLIDQTLPNNNTKYLILEWVDGGTLLNFEDKRLEILKEEKKFSSNVFDFVDGT